MASMTVYLIIMGIGIVVLLIGLFGGIDGDAEFDLGGDADFDGDGSASIFSLKVICCFLVGFGAGAAFSEWWVTGPETTHIKFLIDIACGVMGGVFVGWIGWKLIDFTMKQQGSYTFTNDKFIGRRAPLTLGIPKNGIGEASFTIDDHLRTLDVRTEDGSSIQNGEIIEVIRVEGNIGLVRPVSYL